MNALLDELNWRGFVAQSTDADALAAHLDAGPITSYVGFDPTAASLHIGHLVQLLVARRIQEGGHRPILLVGGATGLIGDPKLTGERVMNDAAVVQEWAERLRQQVSDYVSFEGDNAALVVNNYDWTSTLSTLDFLRDVGKHFPVNRMLARDVVARRLEAGISFTEFAYVLLQSLDYRELYRQYGSPQTGAQDQWGNITAGIDFIRRTEGVRCTACDPLLTKADGSKFARRGRDVWIDLALTSPFAFHQFWLNAEDAKVIEYLKISPGAPVTRSPNWPTRPNSARSCGRPSGAGQRHHRAGPRHRRTGGCRAGRLRPVRRGELTDLPESSRGRYRVGRQPATEDGRLPLVADARCQRGVASKSAGRRAIAEGASPEQPQGNRRRAAPVRAICWPSWAVLRRGAPSAP